MDDQGAAGMKMASNSSLHSVRVEQKGNSCLLVLVWLTIIIITFTAGGTGPDVLEKGAHGAVINATNVESTSVGVESGFWEGDDEVRAPCVPFSATPPCVAPRAPSLCFLSPPFNYTSNFPRSDRLCSALPYSNRSMRTEVLRITTIIK